VTESEKLIHDGVRLACDKIQLVNDRVSALQESQQEIFRRLFDLRTLIEGIK